MWNLHHFQVDLCTLPEHLMKKMKKQQLVDVNNLRICGTNLTKIHMGLQQILKQYSYTMLQNRNSGQWNCGVLGHCVALLLHPYHV